jgi:flavorubredoxin
VICSQVGAIVCVNDFIGREAKPLAEAETFSTGKYHFRYVPTPHLPHGWDAGVLFEETEKTLLCSDLFHQTGDVEPLTESDVVGRSHAAMREYQAGILADYVPYTPLTARNINKLVALNPRTLAVMHGSSFRGDCGRALADLEAAYRDVFGDRKQEATTAA